jgi:hypothetical protein
MSLEHSPVRQKRRHSNQPPHPSAAFSDLDAFSIEQFCWRHSISRSLFYLLLKTGEGPDLMRIGNRVLISRESAARWRKAREEAAAESPASA